MSRVASCHGQLRTNHAIMHTREAVDLLTCDLLVNSGCESASCHHGAACKDGQQIHMKAQNTLL